MAGFILGTGSGVLAAAATYYTLSTHLHRDTNVLRDELERTTKVIDSSLNPSAPAAPVAYIGPSRDPYVPTFGDQLRLKWNRALETGVDSIRETDWTAVGAGVVQGGKDIVGKLNGEVSQPPSTATATGAGPDLRSTLDNAKQTLHDAEKAAERGAARAIENVQDGATTAGRAVEGSTRSLLDRIGGAFSGAKSRADAAVAEVQREADKAASTASREAHHVGDAASDAAHRIASSTRKATASLRDETQHLASSASSTAKSATASLRDEAEHLASSASSTVRSATASVTDEVEHLASSASSTAKSATASLRSEAKDLASAASSTAHHAQTTLRDAAHRTEDSVRDAAQAVHDKISPPPPSTAQRFVDGIKDAVSGAVGAVEDKAEELKQRTDAKVNHLMLEKQIKGKEEYHEGILKGASGAATTSSNGVDVNKESFTGGSSLYVRSRRRAEGTVQGRLV